MIGKGTVAALVLTSMLAACNNEKAQQEHDQAIAAVAASSAAVAAAAAQAEKDKASATAAASQAAVQAAALQAQKDVATKAKAAADLRADVQQNPSKYLQVSAPQAGTHGILNKTSELGALTVLNASPFALTGLHGTATWSDGSTTPFTLSGSIPAGATVTFTTANGTLAGKPAGGRVTPQQFAFAPATVVAPAGATAAALGGCPANQVRYDDGQCHTPCSRTLGPCPQGMECTGFGAFGTGLDRAETPFCEAKR
jgi:hypothetical protein